MTAAPDLVALEQRVEQLLATGAADRAEVLGYGEISSVLAWPGPDGPWACKRLPPFADAASLDAYRHVLDTYIESLTARGTTVLDSVLTPVPRDDRVVAYIVQPVLPPGALGPDLLRAAGAEDGRELLEEVVDRVAATVDARVGLDGQLSNWARRDGHLVYLDLTTPMLRDPAGAELLDTGLFLASLPAALRPVVRRFLLRGITDTYYRPRSVARDLGANLHKEGLSAWVPVAIEAANRRLGTDLTIDEVGAYYRRDARMWALLQRLRRLDRTWQRRVRRRPYPFLLPGRVDRRL